MIDLLISIIVALFVLLYLQRVEIVLFKRYHKERIRELYSRPIGKILSMEYNEDGLFVKGALFREEEK